MSFGRVSKGGVGRRHGEIILTDLAASSKGYMALQRQDMPSRATLL